MSLLVKASREGQTIARVTPETALWKHVGFAAYRLETGDVVRATACSRTPHPTRFICRPGLRRLYEQIAMRKSVWRARPLRASTRRD